MLTPTFYFCLDLEPRPYLRGDSKHSGKNCFLSFSFRSSFQDSNSIEAICSLAFSRSDSRLELFRISKDSPSALTSSAEPDPVESVDLGEHDPSGLGTGGVDALGIEAK